VIRYQGNDQEPGGGTAPCGLLHRGLASATTVETESAAEEEDEDYDDE
jgi:hypothetical protein